jgi:predicted double-glycine peptidase
MKSDTEILMKTLEHVEELAMNLKTHAENMKAASRIINEQGMRIRALEATIEDWERRK